MSTPGQLAQTAYEASINPTMSATAKQAIATLAASAYAHNQETRSS